VPSRSKTIRDITTQKQVKGNSEGQRRTRPFSLLTFNLPMPFDL
jgi:hypothetical protein